jgi:hypothetical protein
MSSRDGVWRASKPAACFISTSDVATMAQRAAVARWRRDRLAGVATKLGKGGPLPIVVPQASCAARGPLHFRYGLAASTLTRGRHGLVRPGDAKEERFEQRRPADRHPLYSCRVTSAALPSESHVARISGTSELGNLQRGVGRPLRHACRATGGARSTWARVTSRLESGCSHRRPGVAVLHRPGEGYGPHKPKRCNSRPAMISANCGPGVIGAAVGSVASAV